jgi:hypothetical protein
MSQLQYYEQIAIEVLETISKGDNKPTDPVITTLANFTFSYEDLHADRFNANIIKHRLNSTHEKIMYKKLRRRILCRKYSQVSREKKKVTYTNLKTTIETIVEQAKLLFNDHPNLDKFIMFCNVNKDI